MVLLGASGCSGLLYYPTPQLYHPPAAMGLHPEEVRFTSADGTKLFGWLFRSPQPKAVVVFYHGNAENLSSHYLKLVWLVAEGYDLFVFDYRGYGQSEGKPTPAGTTADGAAALRWTKARYPHTPIVIYGQSLGGAIALRNAVDLRDEIPYRAVVADSTFLSYQEVGRRVLARGWLSWPFQWLPWLVLSDRYAPGEEIRRLSPRPLLVLHAEGDEVVPFACGEHVFAAAGEPKEFWHYPGGGHGDVYYRHEEYRQKLLEWLETRALH